MIQSYGTNHRYMAIFIVCQWNFKVFSVKGFNVPIDWSYLGILELNGVFHNKFANNAIVVLFHS